MATNGVKIIDGDLARDTYNRIMDLYDCDASISIIKKEVPFVKTDFGIDTDFYYEIFVTVYALAFWEIGELTDEISNEVKRTIELRAGVKAWSEDLNEAEGKKREKELDKFLTKISKPNLQIRKRKKYKLITNFCFQPDDVLSFKLSNNMYYAVICTNITQHRGQCTYDLAVTNYEKRIKPKVDDLKANNFLLGRIIPAGFDEKTLLSEQPGIEKIWDYCKKGKRYCFGLDYSLVIHKDIINFKDNFEIVGKLTIENGFKRRGSYHYNSSFSKFQNTFNDLENYMKIFQVEKFPINLLCKM